MAGLAGYLMRFQAGGSPVNVKITECNSELSTDLLDVTNSESSGNKESTFGVSQGRIDIVVVAEIADTPYTTLGAGQAITAKFLPNKGATGSYISGTLNIGSWQSRDTVRGFWSVHVTGEFTGAITKASL